MSDNESPFNSDIDEVSDDEDNEVIKPAQKLPKLHPVFYEDEDENGNLDVNEDDEEDNTVTQPGKNVTIKIPVDDIDWGSDDDYEDEEEENENEVIPTIQVNKKEKVKTIPVDNIGNIIPLDSDDEYVYDENYLQKMDSEITKNYILKYHPECLQHNYSEIAIMTKVVRDSSNIIVDPLHKTIPYLTKYEKSKVLGFRAIQIENDHPPFIAVPKNIVDSYIIAELELEQKKIPFIIQRPIPNGGFEYWYLKDLEIISF